MLVDIMKVRKLEWYKITIWSAEQQWEPSLELDIFILHQ